jgi:putative ABC transport system substrate-binding protein
MRRREFVGGGLATAVASPLTAYSQGSLRRVGFVSWRSSELTNQAEEFRKALDALGYVEGRDVTVEVYFTDDNEERTREAVRKLVREKVDVLVASTTPAIAVAKQESSGVPIIMAASSDPIAAGFVQSLARPGGNLTGLATLGPEMAGKRIELMKEVKPGLRRVAFLGSSKDINAATFVRQTRSEADRSGIGLTVYFVGGPDAITGDVFDAMRRDQAEAIIIQPIFTGHQEKIVALANAAELPVVADYPVFARAGAVLAYGIDDLALMRRAAYYVDRIFKGARPAELPVQQPTVFTLAINRSAAKRFGWTISPSLLARADEVIE